MRKAPEHHPKPPLYTSPSDTALHQRHWVQQRQNFINTPHELRFYHLNCYRTEGRRHLYVFAERGAYIMNLGQSPAALNGASTTPPALQCSGKAFLTKAGHSVEPTGTSGCPGTTLIPQVPLCFLQQGVMAGAPAVQAGRSNEIHFVCGWISWVY